MRWRATAALLITLLTLAGGIQMSTKSANSPHAHRINAPVAGSQQLPSMLADHPHLQDGSTMTAPPLMATLNLPRTTTTLLALGVLVVIGTAARCWRELTLHAGRGPPRPAIPIQSGRTVLTRLCISQR